MFFTPYPFFIVRFEHFSTGRTLSKILYPSTALIKKERTRTKPPHLLLALTIQPPTNSTSRINKNISKESTIKIKKRKPYSPVYAPNSILSSFNKRCGLHTPLTKSISVTMPCQSALFSPRPSPPLPPPAQSFL